jgi:predicted alpha/beta hydrolase family esterase
MITTASNRFRILIVPGLHDSGSGHWQTLWQQEAPSFERVEQESWDHADIESWSARIASTLRRSARPAVVVAHSFGCLAAVHAAAGGARNLHGLFMVAPADPDHFSLGATLRSAKLPCPAAIVASTNDPWMSVDSAAWWAHHWGAEFFVAGKLGHINADSGIGAWPQGVAQFERLLARLPPPASCACGAHPATGALSKVSGAHAGSSP